ncbi:GspE/PulE family protein [Halomonas nitroreducens]|uniref:Type II/IV secretion system protein n=1 Tax=Halomonas nitroreducens TaxID=447425 RepID=A0A431V4K7_9GAMM|nr:ATPase, T2SS/T4P/T4SS family [Halomonas nitroreducens]RTR05309.1 type II/IV secretion system protein [Halomonas nitroreducens]
MRQSPHPVPSPSPETFLPSLSRLIDTPPTGEEVLEVHALLGDALRARASDIHLDPFEGGLRLRLRIDGHVVDAATVEAGLGQRLINQFKVLAGLNPVPSLATTEGSFGWSPDESGEVEEHFLRVTAVKCVAGEKLAVRFLAAPPAFPDPGALGLGEHGVRGLRRWLDATAGMLLVAGPTGAGKTTTLYTLLEQLRLSDSQVVTLEDPVEYELPGINQVQVDAGSGLDFASGTRSMLRLDPDYVLIGELRDPGSAQAAVSVANGGRSLMATLHSRDAVGVVSTLRQLGLDDAEIAASLGLVIAQRLVRRLCTACRRLGPVAPEEADWLSAVGAAVPRRAWSAVGCERCQGLGYYGRTGVFEVWQPSAEDQGRLLRHADEIELRRGLVERGETLMLADGLAKAEAGVTTLREALRMGAILAA